MRVQTVYLTVPNAEKQEFLHLTDLHLALSDERESEAVRAHSGSRIALFEEQGGCHTPDALHEMADYAVAHGLPVLMTGDICDFPSAANLDLLTEELSRTVGWHGALGNHDYNFGPLEQPHCESHETLARHAAAVGRLYRDDFSLFSFDRGGVRYLFFDNDRGGRFTDAQCDALERALDAGLHLLLFFHVPLYNPELYDLVMNSWRQPIVSCAPDELANDAYRMDVPTRRFRDLIAAHEPQIAALVTGHLHFGHTGTCGTVPQIVTPGGYQNIATHFIING